MPVMINMSCFFSNNLIVVFCLSLQFAQQGNSFLLVTSSDECALSELALERLSTRDNFDQFGCNCNLACLVILQLKVGVDVIGIASGIIHSLHLGGELRCAVLQECSIEAHHDIELSEALQNLRAFVFSLKCQERVILHFGNERISWYFDCLYFLGAHVDALVVHDGGRFWCTVDHLFSDRRCQRESGRIFEALADNCSELVWVCFTNPAPHFSTYRHQAHIDTSSLCVRKQLVGDFLPDVGIDTPTHALV